MLLKHAVDGSAGDKVALRQLAETVAPLTVPQDSVAIKNKWFTSDVAAFELGPPHASPYSLDDEVALQFGDGSDDDHNSSAQGTTSVDLFAEADELDVEPVEFVQHFEEVPHGPGDAIGSPDQDDIEPSAAGIAHHGVESRTLSLGSTDPVGKLLDDLVATLLSHLAEVVELGLGVLIEGRDSHIEGGAFHRGS